jgi:cytoskeletal protein RodZ
MADTGALLVVITVLLALILWKLGKIDARMRERFPTEKEADYDLSQKDPMGHWEAHKDDKNK